MLDRCAEGASLGEALAAARGAGFAEADASDDLSGADAARKLRILCRHSFRLDPIEIPVVTLDERVVERQWAARRTRRVLRQIARASRIDGELRATVAFEEVHEESPFGRLTGEWNALQVLTKDGASTLHEWPRRGLLARDRSGHG